MSNALKLRADGALDFVSLGALVHRLDPGVVPFRKASECRIHVSGGEYNVAANLSDCFRLKTGVVSAMVDYPIGDLIAERVRAMGVKPFFKRFAHNGVNGPNMATVYSDTGFGVRPPVVFYNRANEAAAQLRPGDVDWGEVFAGGVKWFHSGGIFASLSETTGQLIVEGMRAAKAQGAVTSFDLNFREKLWGIWGGEKKAVDVIAGIVEHVDVLVGNEEDLQKGLGIPGPEVAAKSKLDPGVFLGMIGKVTERHPGVKVVATTLREVESTNRHRWAAVAWIDGSSSYLADVRPRGARPGRRRRRFRERAVLRPPLGRDRRKRREARLGARRAAHHLPRRYDHGDAGAGPGLHEGGIGADPALSGTP